MWPFGTPFEAIIRLLGKILSIEPRYAFFMIAFVIISYFFSRFIVFAIYSIPAGFVVVSTAHYFWYHILKKPITHEYDRYWAAASFAMAAVIFAAAYIYDINRHKRYLALLRNVNTTVQPQQNIIQNQIQSGYANQYGYAQMNEQVYYQHQFQLPTMVPDQKPETPTRRIGFSYPEKEDSRKNRR
ncbi:hypothetical protein [Thermoanaerobacter pentosaceus]|uniref:Uncharacterized protein n=1 Tax=Thermoanaerobacter pentosaceus TaxID=694059 RepID=A0ABT9M2K5_9THEO|nr:hypothetical protein [Thermoanaerobacter pentosaceus]MDP9750357.1 hypothetical protein [Thermoanaerobacter pentosaceus]